MYICKSVADLLKGLRHSLTLAEKRRDDPTNRQKDTAFYRGEVAGLAHAIELTEALERHEKETAVEGVDPTSGERMNSFEREQNQLFGAE